MILNTNGEPMTATQPDPTTVYDLADVAALATAIVLQFPPHIQAAVLEQATTLAPALREAWGVDEDE